VCHRADAVENVIYEGPKHDYSQREAGRNEVELSAAELDQGPPLRHSW
jgi:hypothetical protein